MAARFPEEPRRAANAAPAGASGAGERNGSAGLLSPLTLRGVTLRNRIGVSPMCQYSCEDGLANDWHLVHLGSRAAGGAALVMVEATAVTPEGRITPRDMGIWDGRHVEPLARIARFVRSQGAVPGIQLAHAGRKASRRPPWEGRGYVPPADGGWTPVGPRPLAFADRGPAPAALDESGIDGIVRAFAVAAGRAVAAGFQVIEIHSAHGYLLHEFLSPLTNHRDDRYGGSLDNRTRFLMRVAEGVRAVIPEGVPLFVRISATDWVEGGWDPAQSVELAKRLREVGVDLIDASSGGIRPDVPVPAAKGYQVPFARRIRAEAGIRTATVGRITEAAHADAIIHGGGADLVFLARQMIRDPYWALHAEEELAAEPTWPLPDGYALDPRRP